MPFCRPKSSKSSWSGDSSAHHQPDTAASTVFGRFGDRVYRFFTDLRRDTDNGKIAGVCAGVANALNVKTCLVRVGFVIFLFMNFPVAIALYAIAWIMVPAATFADAVEKPAPATAPSIDKEATYDMQNAANQDEAHALPPHLRFERLRRKFKDLEAQTVDLETKVTSGEFALNRSLKEI